MQACSVTYYLDRDRATSFGDDAERYDRARPSYPDRLVDDLLTGGPEAVLDVGCGTGLAGRLFLARGCAVLGVEPDPRMAAVARRHGLAVEEATFEQWDAGGRTFGLLISGQAWHWVDPNAGSSKAAQVLTPGGHFAAMWNRVSHADDVRSVLEDAYAAHAPQLIEDNVPLGTNRRRSTRDDPELLALVATGDFVDPERRKYDWTRTYTPGLWIDEILTHSIHRNLDPGQRASLLESMKQGLDRIGEFAVHITTIALVATRRPA
jgi:SAM-dependent methyltransferase